MENYLNQRNETKAYYFHISASRLIFLSIFSCGIFETYWMYKNWKYIQEKTGEQLSAFWRAVFGVFYCRKLLKAIHEDSDLCEIDTPRFSPIGLTAGWILLVLLAQAVGEVEEAGTTGTVIAWLMPSYLFLAPVQGYINNINFKRGVYDKHTLFSKGHILCYIIGTMFWSLLLIPINSDGPSSYENVSIQDILHETAEEINKDMPMTVDSQTRCDSAISMPNKTLMYLYTMVNISASEIDEDFFVSEMRPHLVNVVSTTPEMATFRDYNVTMAYKYRDKNGVEIATIEVTPEDYK